jgi:hypothetical protein
MGGSSGTDGGRSSKIVPLGRWFLRVLYWKTNREVKPSRSPPKTGTQGPSVAVHAGVGATITSTEDYNDEDKSVYSGATSCSSDSEFDLLVT